VSLLHAEYVKITRRKLYPIMLALLALLMGFIAVLFYVILPALPDSAQAGAPPPRPEAFVYGAVQVAGQAWWFAVILATTLLGGEVAGTVWATGLTRDARKSAHIASRFAVFTTATWLAFIVGTAVWSVVTLFAAEGSGSPEAGEWLSLLWKFAVIAGSWTSIGMGAVALTRSIGAAMGIALGISFVDSIIAPFVSAYENFSLTAASNGIFAVGSDDPFAEFIPGGDMSTTHALLVMAGWTLLGLGLTWWGLQRRDA
jgi:hypothetical protein